MTHNAENDVGNPYEGTSLAGWADALRESDEAMDETLAAARETRPIPPAEKGQADA